eukprot:7209423-Lingulodinium_polyedra.AAC.1
MCHHMLAAWWQLAKRQGISAAALFVDAADAFYAARTRVALPEDGSATPTAMRRALFQLQWPE